MKFGKVRVSRRKDLNPAAIIYHIVGLIILFWVGDEIIEAVTTDINVDAGYFTSAYTFLGVSGSGTGIIGIVGIILVASLALRVVKIELN